MFDDHKAESIPSREERILAFWRKSGIFEKSLKNRENAPLFATYDGPPFATGLPHYGHILAGTIKDVVLRFKTLDGYYVPRRFGWDCHGLPVEAEVEKKIGVTGSAAMREYGIAKFNEECRGIVQRFTGEWESTVHRMGRFVDFGCTFRTMDPSFMESVWWVFSEIYKKGLIYEGYKVMPFSAALGTPLSNFEAGDNYKDVDDPSLTLTFPLVNDPDVCLLAWTTTPWTLPSNLALTVGPEMVYVKLRSKDKTYILAESRVAAYFKEGEFEVLGKMVGTELEGLEYEPPFEYFAQMRAEGAFRVIVNSFVTDGDGTGVVHTAPAFGEQDFYAAKAAGIPLVCPVDENGKFTKEVPDFQGQFVKDADKGLMRVLKDKGRIFKQTTIHHSYPFCYRTDTPLIYRAVGSWFVAVEKMKDEIIEVAKEINWIPGHIKEGRFGKWLEGARDWAISRNRLWGTPLPVWKSESGKVIVIGSKAELEERCAAQLKGKKIDDLHRHFIDHLTFEEDGETYKRIDEIFDCWFESGSMPYAQNHYPFESRQETEASFPADFIAEGLDQTRCWFYTLTVLSTALFKRPAFKNVIVNGIVLNEEGKKMSKSKKNYPDPLEVINELGADAVRLYLLASPAVQAENVSFSKTGVQITLRQVLIPLWNSFSFLSTYARIDKWKGSRVKGRPERDIDRWMLSQLQKLILEVKEGMDGYELNRATGPIVAFVDGLTNWYIRLNRSRFWSDEKTPDREMAFEVLYTVLKDFTVVIAAFAPFIAEAIYQELKLPGDPESVHLCDYPKYDASRRDASLEAEMDVVQAVVSSGLSLRKEEKIKVRQPLKKAIVICANDALRALLERGAKLIAHELNVKEVVIESDEKKWVDFEVKANFKTLGKRAGKHMRAVQVAVETLPADKQKKLLSGQPSSISIEGEEFMLAPEDVLITRIVKGDLVARAEGEITLVLETQLNEELELEGIAREIVNKVNTMRRDDGFDVSDRITLIIDTSERVKKAFEIHRDYICGEVLATHVTFAPNTGKEWELNDEKAVISVNVIKMN